MMPSRLCAAVLGACLFLSIIHPAFGAEPPGRSYVPGQVPAVVHRLRAIDSLPATQQLHFVITLPLRNPDGLNDLLHQLYTPGNPHYRRFLAPGEFGARFGPAAADYQALVNFLQQNGLTIARSYADHTMVEAAGPVAAIEKTFQTHLRVYRHPREARTFYAPDGELSVAAALPVKILGISGLDNYALPRPASLHTLPPKRAGGNQPNAGSGPGGDLLGHDFRYAYLPASRLTGTGQSVALLEFDGYYPNDITAYETLASLPPVPLTIVPVNGGVVSPGAGNDEVSLDIEMVISMATNVSRVLVYEAPSGTTWQTMLKQIADDDSAAQVSSSWYSGGGPDPASEQIFQQMAAQGQSFFEACGDYDAFTGPVSFPLDSTNITLVGGTTLTTVTRSGARSTETVWNRGLDAASGLYIGTGGGVSTFYSIPSWQQGINSILTNGGSTTFRNIPDVAMVAEGIYVTYGDGLNETAGGTSCAAPLWAGLMALANQQAATNGLPSIGFINPIIYEIANESVYNTAFFDVTVGSNAWPGSPNAYFAVPGYDLCTGLGTPKGTNLINLLVKPDPLSVTPSGGFNAHGTPAGTFDTFSEALFLTNAGAAALTWSLVNTSAWLTVSNTGGTLAPGAGDSVVVTLNNVASNLIAGTYSANLWFTNLTGRVGHSRFFTLQTSDPLVIQPPAQVVFQGPPDGPFSPGGQSVVFTNASVSPLNWTVNNTSAWFNVSPMTGSLAPGGRTNVTLVPAPAATNLPDGFYVAQIQITNLTTTYAQAIQGEISVGLIQNGGFETGDFTDWTLVGNTSLNGNIYNAVVDVNSLSDNTGYEYIHSGDYGAFLGDTNLATLSQSFETIPGQAYLLSFWVDNPASGSGQEFMASWITNGVVDTVFSVIDPPVLGWTNVVAVVTAAGTNTTLQFAAENPPGGFGLDDISVDPVTPPIFTSQPTNLTLYTGGTAILSGSVKGPAPMSYQWQDAGTNLVDGGSLSGSASSTLTISPAAYANTGSYTLVVTNNYGSVTSSVAVVTVLIPPTIGNISLNPGGGINLGLSGTPGYPYILEAATNLMAPVIWYPIATNTLDASGVWLFTDLSATNRLQQFYRLTTSQ